MHLSCCQKISVVVFEDEVLDLMMDSVHETRALGVGQEVLGIDSSLNQGDIKRIFYWIRVSTAQPHLRQGNMVERFDRIDEMMRAKRISI